MQGEVLYFDPERGVGFISGTDGNRYHFDRTDLSSGTDMHKGERVEFLNGGNRARNVISLDAPPEAVRDDRAPRPPGSTGVSSVPLTAAERSRAEPAPGLSLFGYFRACITGRYANFRGRARRKEFWGFMLFSVLTVALLTVTGVAIDAALGNLDREEPVFTSIFAGVVALAMMIPSLAVTVRRIHDIGLSGWFVLLGLIPSVGNLIIIVFALIPSQKHANRWGPLPARAPPSGLRAVSPAARGTSPRPRRP